MTDKEKNDIDQIGLFVEYIKTALDKLTEIYQFDKVSIFSDIDRLDKNSKAIEKMNTVSHNNYVKLRKDFLKLEQIFEDIDLESLAQKDTNAKAISGDSKISKNDILSAYLSEEFDLITESIKKDLRNEMDIKFKAEKSRNNTVKSISVFAIMFSIVAILINIFF